MSRSGLRSEAHWYATSTLRGGGLAIRCIHRPLVVNQREQAAVEAKREELKALVDYQRARVDLLATTVALEPWPEERPRTL